MEEGMDWGIATDINLQQGVTGGRGQKAGQSSPSSSPMADTCAASTSGRTVNRSLANWLVLRGQAAGDVDVTEWFPPSAAPVLGAGGGFGTPHDTREASSPAALMHPDWVVDPLMVSSSPHKFNK